VPVRSRAEINGFHKAGHLLALKGLFAAIKGLPMNKTPPIAITTNDLYYLTAQIFRTSEKQKTILPFLQEQEKLVDNNEDLALAVVEHEIKQVDIQARTEDYKKGTPTKKKVMVDFIRQAQRRGFTVNDGKSSIFAKSALDYKKEVGVGRFLYRKIFNAPAL
jgi:hypothetical protein